MADRARQLVPFGLATTKPHHFREMLRVAWRNRDNAGYAWRVLSEGVCDGCALGVAGLHDWTIEGPHVCLTRLALLRLNTMPAADIAPLEDIEAFRRSLNAARGADADAGWDNAQLRELGRLPYPMLRESGAKGFRRITWDEAYPSDSTGFNGSSGGHVPTIVVSAATKAGSSHTFSSGGNWAFKPV